MIASTVPAAKPARYNAVCKKCGKTIFAGSPITPEFTGKSRPRWVHEDCDNAPTSIVVAIGGDGANAEATDVQLRQEVARLAQRVAELETHGSAQVVEVRRPDGECVKLEGTVHPAFNRVLQLANARKNIFLPGPAGCGKSHLAGQVAEALGLAFGFISCSAGMSEASLLGRMVPQGASGSFEFVGTEFLRCYEEGGVFLFDEIDAADSNVLLVINAALANGHMSVPARAAKPVAKRHPDFICIAAANTFGRGADRLYAGRNQLDESTLDRFRIGTVPMDYDAELERQLCPDDKLRTVLLNIRDAVRANRLERVVSTRFLRDAAEMVGRWGWTREEAVAQLFQGWRADEVAKVGH